jgi:hypothetical protein
MADPPTFYLFYLPVEPQLASAAAGKAADNAIGVSNGLIGRAIGLAGMVVAVWCTLRRWPRDEQCAAFQPIGVGIFLTTGL